MCARAHVCVYTNVFIYIYTRTHMYLHGFAIDHFHLPFPWILAIKIAYRNRDIYIYKYNFYDIFRMLILFVIDMFCSTSSSKSISLSVSKMSLLKMCFLPPIQYPTILFQNFLIWLRDCIQSKKNSFLINEYISNSLRCIWEVWIVIGDEYAG